MPELGDQPIEEKHREQMVAVVQTLDEFFNGEVGVVLLVFPFGDKEGRCTFISNGADRRDVVVLMREMITRFEGQPEMKGTA